MPVKVEEKGFVYKLTRWLFYTSITVATEIITNYGKDDLAYIYF